LPTIRSRCRRIDLRPVDHATLAAALLDRGADEPTAAFLARFARGRPGLAFTALSDPGVSTALQTAFAQLRALLAAPTPERLEGLDALASGQGAQREVTMAVLETWLEWWRDALLVKAGCPSGVVHAGELSAYLQVAEAIDLRGIRRALRDVVEAGSRIDLNANPRLVLDVLALRLPTVPGLAEPAAGQEPADATPLAAPARAAGAASGSAT
jgi:DNA polymerase III gamma/tau subunit